MGLFLSTCRDVDTTLEPLPVRPHKDILLEIARAGDFQTRLAMWMTCKGLYSECPKYALVTSVKRYSNGSNTIIIDIDFSPCGPQEIICGKNIVGGFIRSLSSTPQSLFEYIRLNIKEWIYISYESYKRVYIHKYVAIYDGNYKKRKYEFRASEHLENLDELNYTYTTRVKFD
jgi:hypothetical protein